MIGQLFDLDLVPGRDPGKDIVPAAVKTVMNPVDVQGKPFAPISVHMSRGLVANPHSQKCGINSLCSRSGGFDAEAWHSARTNVLHEIGSVLMRIAPQNFPAAVEALCKMCCNDGDEGDMDLDVPSSSSGMPEMINYAADFLRQTMFCRQQLLSSVAIVLGLLMQTRKEVVQHLGYRTESFVQLMRYWAKFATLHSLCSAPLTLTGENLAL